MLLLISLIFFCQILFATPPPDLPGVEVKDTEKALIQSEELVQTKTSTNNRNLGWTAPSLEEQQNMDETFIGMGQGAIFVPSFTESRLEPEYRAVKIDSMSKENMNREWTGRTGVRLVVPYGDYNVFIGSGSEDKKIKYDVKVNEGKTTTVHKGWGGLVINTINEDGEFISESYEIFSVNSGESYGKGFGLTQERLTDIKTWILPPRIYRISRSGENVSSISNYITVQVNEGTLTNVELVFEEETGRLVAGGVHRMRLNTAKDSYWTYGIRLGGSASYTSLLELNNLKDTKKKNDAWNALGDLRLRANYNRSNLFWLTELYLRENVLWIDEEQEKTQWSIAQDLFQFQSSVVYRYLDWLGPYIKANIKTHILPEYYFISEDTTVYRVDMNDTIVLNGDRIKSGSSFDPLRIGESVGLNLRSLFSNSVDISAQTGFAARQIIRNNLLIPANKEQTIFIPANNNIYDYGWENSLNIRFLLSRYVTLDLLGEVFFPKGNPKHYMVEELSLDLRIALTRFLEFSYLMLLTDRVAAGLEDAKGMSRFESLNTLQLRLYVNF